WLFNAWHLNPVDSSGAQDRDDLQGWTVSSLCSTYLSYQLDRHERWLQQQQSLSAPSLASMSLKILFEQLSQSLNLDQDIKSIAESLGEGQLRHILQDPQTPYVMLHRFHAHTAVQGSSVDDAILASEQHVRSQHPKPSNFLVTLDDMKYIIGPPDQDGTTTFTQDDPPKGGFEFLNEKIKPTMQIVGADFKERFNHVTNGCLEGLDWQNVFVAGGMILNTLLHTRHLDEASDPAPTDVSDCDVDLYLYNLTPEEANRKVEHIYDIWYKNIHDSQNNPDQRIVKTSRTITFIPKYPLRRIQIILKLLPSPVDILLNFDLDACALGSDGSQVLMLPRAARALETGYSTFTMDLIWGHHLGNRRESQEVRVFKYADRGFGLRILPSYVASLEVTSAEDTDHEIQDNRKGPSRTFKGEAGLKTLKRIAHLAQKFVQEYCASRPVYIEGDKPLISLAAMDGYAMHDGLPDQRKGLPMFEVLMRHCEAWKMDALGTATLERQSFASLSYDDPNEYDGGWPTYDWGPHSMTFAQFDTLVDEHNNELFWILRRAIAEKLNIGPRDGRYVDYLTRRIRRLVIGPDLESVSKQQITMPFIVPMTLEVAMDSELTARCAGTPGLKPEHLPSLIPVHDPSKHDPRTATVPSLADTVKDSGNLRYWLITNENMWAGLHRAADEVSELLTALFDWFLQCERLRGWDTTMHGTDAPQCIRHLAKAFRRRLVLPKETDTRVRGQLSKREARLFRPWALVRPARVKRAYDEEGQMESLEDRMEQEGDVDDGVFWNEGDDLV
ncbi:MAG: hypothetical protein Q9205_002274, partial [Flavoplaca limonia]